MHYLNRLSRKNGDEAVSPVVGVMLMLVVTIIIAAVVSGFAGSMIGSKDKAPTIAMDVAIKNAGTFANSYFEAKVISVSQPVNTSDLKMVTTWGKNGANHVSTMVPGSSLTYWTWSSNRTIKGAPWGYGPGVTAMNSGIPNNLEQEFGNYTLYGGTLMYVVPAGQGGGFVNATNPASTGYGVVTPYTYTGWTYAKGTSVDGMQTLLGDGWETLRSGDTVHVKLVYTPSGSVIFDKNVVVS